jgi:hypothetical protein
MAVITVELTDNLDQWRVKQNSVSTKLGDVDTLSTTADNIVGAVNEMADTIGDLSDLTIPATSTVSALNQVKADFDALATADQIPRSVIIAIG